MRYQMRLAFAPEGDEALLAHLGEVLRQCGLRKADCLRQRPHVRFAPFHQLAEDHQPALVAERAQHARGLRGVSLEGREVECLAPIGV